MKLRAAGRALTAKALSNEDMRQYVDTSDEWITTRTGIRQRYFCGEGENTTTLAIAAAKQALERSGLDPKEIDCMMVATSSGEYAMPSTACLVHAALGLREDERTRQHEGLYAHVEQARDDAARVVRVQRRQDEVPRERRLHGDVGRLAVADFADEHDVGVLSEDASEDAREGEALRDVDVALVHACELVFDGVLGRYDVYVRGVEVLQAGVERRRLA
jgi:hypothetical protein